MADLTDPFVIDRALRPAPADVVAAELDGELVIYNPADHRIHHLDRTGSLVWQLLDGDASVGELVDDIANAFGAPPEVVEADVRSLLEELHGEGLLQGSASAIQGEAYPADHLSDPPNPCESDAGRLELASAFTIRVAGRDVALRTSPGIDEPLQTILAPLVVDTDPDEAPAHFSAYVPGRLEEVNRLYHGFCPQTRSVDPGRVLRALIDHAAMALPPVPGTMSVYARAAIIDGERAVMLPHVLDKVLQRYDARLRMSGVVLTDSPVLGLDVERAELVLEDRLGFGPQLDELGATLPSRRREPGPEPGRYPIERWWFMWYLGGSGTVSRAQAARRVAQIADPGHDLDAAVIHRLGTMFEHVEPLVGDLERADPVTMLVGRHA